MFNSKKNLEILRKAFDVIAREEAKALPTPEECTHVTFSEEFEQKMQKLINKEKKPYYYLINTVGKRVACVIIAVLLALTSVTFGVKAIREAVIDFFVETFEKFSIVGFKDEDIPHTLDHIETYYTPSYIPEGYILKEEKRMLSCYWKQFISQTNYIYYTQNLNTSDNYYLDTELSQTQAISINDNEALLVLKDTSCLLYWNDANYSYVLQSDLMISKEELVKIVKSLEKE